MIRGYKAYRKGLINQFGEKYEVGKTYKTDDIVYEKSGFYFCPELEDTLRYYDGLEEEIDIAIVEGSGKILEFYDDYNETSTIAATELHILGVMTREEIINYALNLNALQLKKFFAGYRLTEDEIKLFSHREAIVKDYIDYYQRGNQNVFKEKVKKR